MSKTDVAFWLGLYASAIASITALWSLFRELWVDRPRLIVTPEEAWLVNMKGKQRPLIVKGDKTLEAMGVPHSARTPVLIVTVRNRGRRDATIESVSQMLANGSSYVFGDLLPHVPFPLAAERSATLALGKDGGYAHGDVSLRRFYVADGAGRIHPLRERYRQRIRRILSLSAERLPPAEPRELKD